jgi:hypothetical protein
MFGELVEVGGLVEEGLGGEERVALVGVMGRCMAAEGRMFRAGGCVEHRAACFSLLLKAASKLPSHNLPHTSLPPLYSSLLHTLSLPPSTLAQIPTQSFIQLATLLHPYNQFII